MCDLTWGCWNDCTPIGERVKDQIRLCRGSLCFGCAGMVRRLLGRARGEIQSCTSPLSLGGRYEVHRVFWGYCRFARSVRGVGYFGFLVESW